jgi:hypothetical protein
VLCLMGGRELIQADGDLPCESAGLTDEGGGVEYRLADNASDEVANAICERMCKHVIRPIYRI